MLRLSTFFLSVFIKKIVFQKLYTHQAKKTLDKYNLNADVIQIAHALLTTPLLSDNNYRHHYLKDVKGKGAAGTGVEFYPGYIKAKQNAKHLSQVINEIF